MDEEITQESGIESEVSIEEAFSNHLTDYEQSEAEREDELDEDTEDGEADASEDEASADELVTVVIDGVERQVSKSDLIATYQKQENSTERYTEAANLKRQAEYEQARAQQERAQAIETIRNYETQLQGFLAQPPNPELINTNPQEYLRQTAAYNNLQTQLQQATQQRAQLEHAQYQELEQSQAVYLEEQGRELIKAIPEWSNDTVATKEKADIKNYLKAQGYTEEHLARVQDHREVLLVRKAMLYDRLLEQHKSGSNKVKPQAPRMERPGGGVKGGKGADAMSRLKKSGSIDDAAAVFASMM